MPGDALGFCYHDGPGSFHVGRMKRRAFLRVAGTAAAAAAAAPWVQPGMGAEADSNTGPAPPHPNEEDWRTLAALLDMASPSYDEPWDDATCRTLMKGAYLGNGDLGAHLGGDIHSLRHYLGKNGFHAGNDVAAGRYNQHILNLAVLVIEGATGAHPGSVFAVTHDIRNAEVRSECTMAGAIVRARAFLAPMDNVMVLELSTPAGRDVPVRATLSVMGNAHVALRAGVDGDVAWVTKEPNAEGAPFHVHGAVAARVHGAAASADTDGRTLATLVFALPASGAPVRLIVHAEHTKDAASPLDGVRAMARVMTDADIESVEGWNRGWWKEFWLRSCIQLGDAALQALWYNHLYMVGSATRPGRQVGPGNAPGHWGPWNRADDMMWFSNLGMNYNAQNPYYGTFAANHVDLVDPYVATVKHYTENTGRSRVVNRWVSPLIAARMPPNCRGVENECSFTSHGTSCGGGRYAEEDCCMATNAVFGILPVVWKWKYGQDKGFLASTCYPLLRAVADFYEDYIGRPVNGRYEVWGSVHEGADWFAKDDMFSLGAVRFLFRETLAASEVLGLDADRRALWRDILENMADYPLQAWGDTVTFRPDAIHDVMDALHYRGGARNTGLMFTTTFDNIGHDTLPAYRIATRRTLDKGNMFHPQRWCGWQNGNDYGIMFVMAVRAGYAPGRVIEAIKGWRPERNGVVSQKEGGGIETAGIIEAINNMLLQSHDGVVRVFPNWDPALDARFRRLRATGAFLVEARYDATRRRVEDVRVWSEKGNECVIQSPFADAGVRVRRADTRRSVAAVQREEVFAFKTEAGVTYEILPARPARPSPRAPVITTHPAGATVVLGGTARFSVAAKGTGLRYQWQKNRRDIPGATSREHTTPPVTLWDTGSRYRCVVSNGSGVARSEAAVLNAGERGA